MSLAEKMRAKIANAAIGTAISSLEGLGATIVALDKQIEEKDAEIEDLQGCNSALLQNVDNLEDRIFELEELGDPMRDIELFLRALNWTENELEENRNLLECGLLRFHVTRG